MSAFASLSDYKAYHIISYGTFVGATFYQSFIAGPVAFKTLPRPMFSRLQQTTFPVFFSLQTILPLVMIFTYPGERVMAAAGKELRINAGLGGILAESNTWTVTLPLAAMLLTSVANLVAIGPLTTKTMKLRHHQGERFETRDGKKSYDAGPHSQEMQRLNKKFGVLHGVSTLSNLIGWAGSLYYAFILADRL
ncbi:hypothetical protein CAC42_3226 [Sphaceloma murrayae]|uniref:TMEM205-like domain-containing protein n=1 Tax=Sphaceloma murrayae TaxID=2082308 RepID=A0A2K1QS11_9PEZI|nr:hypothetical protein CAC42_3226 [Sphaceloma murrayae]